MRPKDSPERTPENDKRMRKKLDKMMRDFVPKEPLGKRLWHRREIFVLRSEDVDYCLTIISIVTDVSSIIIDEEKGIIYSPGLKRSDYMAQRLKDMKEKRENLSPTGMCISRCAG